MASTGPILLHPSRDRPRWRSALASHLPGASVVGPSDDLSAVRYALTWAPPPGLFTVAPRLEVVFALGAGVNHLTGLVPPTVSLVRLTDAGMAAQHHETNKAWDGDPYYGSRVSCFFLTSVSKIMEIQYFEIW